MQPKNVPAVKPPQSTYDTFPKEVIFIGFAAPAERILKAGQKFKTDINAKGPSKKWVATIFTYKNITTLAKKNQQTGECLSGKYLWASDMILVDKVSRASIEEVVRHLVEEEPWEFMEMFRRMDGAD